MALQSNIEIYIGGNPITAIKEFTLSQVLGQHHTFELVCRMDVIEKVSLGAGSLGEDAKNFLGEPISVQLMSLGLTSGYKTLAFKGMVTGVNSLKAFNHKNGDTVVISGHSGTIMTDDGPHYASHIDAGLSDILEKSFTGYDQSKLETHFTPSNNDTLHYSVQHNESNWQYARRLAAQYSEWFYYDGKKLVFGTPDDNEPIVLTYGSDLQEFSMGLRPQPNTFNYFTNDYLSDAQHTKKSLDISESSGYNGFASEKAKTMYAKETNVWVHSYTDPQLKKRLDTQVEQQKKAADQRQVLVKGASDNPGVGLGKIIKIVGEEENYGGYRVIKVVHTSNENGRYQNRFEAVSAEMDVYPLTNVNAIPRSESQTAVVTENADSEGMGRIRVQFSWQKIAGETTPWLRIVTPHSGGDKGFHFIPEIGEEVLIGFEGSNAERPYVMGSLYNGSQRPSSWKTAPNDVKAIRTRSGHTIELNDASGSEFITITDKNQNLITIDTATNDMTITALENMTFNARNMQMNVAENLDIHVGRNKTERIGQTHHVQSSNSNEIVAQTKNINVGGLLNQFSGIANLIATSGDMTIHSKGVSSFQGNADVKISKG